MIFGRGCLQCIVSACRQQVLLLSEAKGANISDRLAFKAGVLQTHRDNFDDVRSAPDTLISIEYNGGFTGACTMLAARQWSTLCKGRPGLLDRAGADLTHYIW